MLKTNVTDIVKEETKLNIVGDTKMQNLKEITIAIPVHKELKKVEVEGIFHMEGVTFEVKRRTIYATKEVSLPKEGSSFMVDLKAKLDAELDAELEIENYVIETMQEFYLEKCHAYAEEHERKYLLEEAERVAKLKEENKEEFVGETEMQEEEVVVNDDIVVKEEEITTGETKMQNNSKNITVYAKIHKNLKPEDVAGIFTLPGTTFEVKEDNIFATKEVSSPKEEWGFMVEAEKHIYEKQEKLIVASFEKMLAQEREENTVVGDIENIENNVDDIVEETENKVVGDTEKMIKITRTMENNGWNYRDETLDFAEKDFYSKAEHSLQHKHYEPKIEVNPSVTEAIITGNRLVYTYKLVGFEEVERAKERAIQQIVHHFFELGFMPTVVNWDINEEVKTSYYRKIREKASNAKINREIEVHAPGVSEEKVASLVFEGTTFEKRGEEIVAPWPEGLKGMALRRKIREISAYIQEQIKQ